MAPIGAGMGTGVGTPSLALAGAVIARKRVYAICRGGVPGTDYLFAWTIVDTLGQRWTRSVPVLCGPTS